MSLLTVKTKTEYREDVQNCIKRAFVIRGIDDIWNICTEHPGVEQGKGANMRLSAEKERILLVTVTAENKEKFPIVYMLRDGSQKTEEVTSLLFSDTAAKSEPSISFIRENGEAAAVDLYSHKGSWEAWAPGSVPKDRGF